MKKVVFLPYDFDTAIGINNEGALVFGYQLEDIDKLSGGADVFNGQQSVLWQNLRAAFYDEIKAMYQKLRSTGALSYERVERMFEEHQGKWPEAIFNEDAYFKYLQPLMDDGTGAYLGMLQGSKAEQRKWWLYNRFRYLDSKYNAGDALTDVIQLRGYAKADITVTPYADIYPAVKYGSYLVTARGAKGSPTTLVNPLDSVNDTEIYLYSASQLASIGDLSGLKVGFADFSMATKLQSIKVGDGDEGYSNGNLTELTVGNNSLLKTVDARNCPALRQAVDLSGARSLEHAYFSGTAITGCALPNGGALRTLELPGTVTNLTVRNQPGLTVFTLPDYAQLTTLRLENPSAAIPVMEILAGLSAGCRVRLTGLRFTAASAAEVETLYDTLDQLLAGMRGLDENGGNLDAPVISGTVSGLGDVNGAWLASMRARYGDIAIVYERLTHSLSYYDDSGSTLLYTEEVADGGDGVYTGRPSKSSTAQYSYTFAGWSREAKGQADADARKNLTAPRSVYAVWSQTLRTYTVRFYNGSTLLQSVANVPYGGSAAYTGETPVKTGVSSPEDWLFLGWSPEPTAIQGNVSCYAQYRSPLEVREIEDSWEEILQAVADGSYRTRYRIGHYKPLDLGSEGVVNMQIAAFNSDDLADGSGKAPITWISKEVLKTAHIMSNPGGTGSWEACGMRTYLKNTVRPLIPEFVRSAIKEVTKKQTARNSEGAPFSQTTADDVWIPDSSEVYNSPKYEVLFTDDASRIKNKVGTASAAGWWLRSASSYTNFFVITIYGAMNNNNAWFNVPGVVLGFCT